MAIVAVIEVLPVIVHAIDRAGVRPANTVARSLPGGRWTGFRVYLGSVPSYAESNDGLLLNAMRDDSRRPGRD